MPKPTKKIQKPRGGKKPPTAAKTDIEAAKTVAELKAALLEWIK